MKGLTLKIRGPKVHLNLAGNTLRIDVNDKTAAIGIVVATGRKVAEATTALEVKRAKSRGRRKSASPKLYDSAAS